MARALIRWMAVSAVVAVSVVPANAERKEKWWEAYDRGVNAVRSRNYEVAVSALEVAVAEIPKESPTRRVGNEIIVYVPYFWLGIARFGLGDVDGALRDWKTSEAQGAVQNTRYYTDLREWVSRGNSEKQKNSENAMAAPRREANTAIGKAVSAQTEAVAAGADRTESYRAAQRKLQEALEITRKSGAARSDFSRAAEIAGAARDLFTAAADEARKQKASRPAVAQKKPAPQQTPAKIQAAMVLPVVPAPQPPNTQTPAVQAIAPPQTSVPAPAPATAQVTRSAEPMPPVESEALMSARVAVQQYRRQLVEAEVAHSHDARFRDWVREAKRQNQRTEEMLRAGKPDEDWLRDTTGDIARKESELRKRVAKIPAPAAQPLTSPDTLRPALEQAYRTFAVGDLERSEALLSRILEKTESGEAYLLRGCTRYTQALLSRESAGLVAAATADFRAALKKNRSLRLDPSAFSPKLVTFFDQLKQEQVR